MARNRSSLRNWTEYLVVRAALATLSIGPLNWAFRLGELYSRGLSLLVPRLRRIGSENLARALPAVSGADRETILRGVFRSIGRTVALFARFPTLNARNVESCIRMEGFEHVEQALARGKGLLIATGHLGNWELSAFAFALLRHPMSVVVRPLDNPRIDALVERYRSASGNRLISKNSNARPILEALRDNEMVGILIDQNFQNGIFIDFFGVPAATAPGFARIAAISGAAVIPGFALWSAAERTYVLRFYPEVPITGAAGPDTQNIQSAIEDVIRTHPDQWLWIHRRWKTQP